ncbi:MAG TPA: hypothetical protein VFX39_01880 [Gemmatimonadaceae bacterium]|nr:hypothetical protein [Gemmatimonadaceae bacterium]
MRTTSPYRSLPPARRVELVTHAVKSSREARALWIQRLVARGGGFRAATLQSWPPDRLAREIVRLGAETAPDELDLMHMLYVEVEPAIQITFLDEAGVPHENGVMPDDLEPPFTDADAVRRAAALVRERHGEDGMRYLRTLARYATEAWPGIEGVASELEG